MRLRVCTLRMGIHAETESLHNGGLHETIH